MPKPKGGFRHGSGRKPGIGLPEAEKRKMWSGYLPYHIVMWLKAHPGPESQGKLIEKALIETYHIQPLPL